jgi:hypothetical protein
MRVLVIENPVFLISSSVIIIALQDIWNTPIFSLEELEIKPAAKSWTVSVGN